MLINNRYQLLEMVGRGGMGVVHRALDRLHDDVVALKQVNFNPIRGEVTTYDADASLALAREFRTLAGLRHPGVVAVLDYGFINEDAPYYTMEFLENARSLTAYARSLDSREKIRLIADMLRALAYLHRRGIVHRDLKATNVLVTQGGVVKVMDFGLAKQADASSQGNALSNMVGTLAYMAPEVFLGGEASVASDLYAAGIMMYEMFAGTLPFDATDVSIMLEHILVKEPSWALLPLSLQPVLQRVLAKEPAVRHPDAEALLEDVSAAMGATLPGESVKQRESYLRASVFVGRKAELRKLRDALDATRMGRGSIWLVGGESGVGKSRLIDELRALALVKGARVLRGQAVADGGFAYQIWREPLRRLVLDIELSDLEASILEQLIPDIAKLLGRPLRPLPELDGTAQRQRLSSTIMDVFARIEMPTLLLLEDLQWVVESLFVLQQLLENWPRFPMLMIVGTYRDDERPALLDELPGIQVLLLQRLRRDEIIDLGQSMLGHLDNDDPLVELVERETEGNAFFIVEVVRFLAERAGSLHDVRNMTLPAGVLTGGMHHLLQRRIERVAVSHRDLLHLAAVAGREINVAVLRQASNTTDQHDAVDNFLREAADAMVLHVVDNQWRFQHDKLREAVLASIADEQRAVFHQRIAAAIETIYPDDDNYYDTLLEHWHAANDVDRELVYAQRLATEYLNKMAEYERGHLILTRTLGRLSDEDPRRLALLNLRARAYWRTGDHRKATELAEKALQLAEKQADHTAKALSIRQLGLAAMHMGRLDDARRYFVESRALYESLQDQAGIASNIVNISVTNFLSGNIAAAFEDAQRGYVLSLELKMPSHTITGLQLMAASSARMNRLDDAVRYFAEAAALAEKIGDRSETARTLMNQGVLFKEMGELVKARDHIQQSTAIWLQLGAKGEMISAYGNLADVLLSLDDLPAAREAIIEALQRALKLHNERLQLGVVVSAAEYLLLTGKNRRAARLLAMVMAHPQRDNEVDNDAQRVWNTVMTTLTSEDAESIKANAATMDLIAQTEALLRELTTA